MGTIKAVFTYDSAAFLQDIHVGFFHRVPCVVFWYYTPFPIDGATVSGDGWKQTD